MKIFGREPAVWVSLIEAVLVLLLAFQVPGLGQDDVVNIVAVTTAALGLYIAYVTRDTLLGVAVGFAKSVIALAIGYGAPLTESQTAALIAVVVVLVGFFQRTQTSPVEHGSWSLAA